MDGKTETQAMSDVRARLAERFPQLGEEVVDTEVRAAHSQLTGPIREFVPVLVEHAARDRLADIADRAARE